MFAIEASHLREPTSVPNLITQDNQLLVHLAWCPWTVAVCYRATRLWIPNTHIPTHVVILIVVFVLNEHSSFNTQVKRRTLPLDPLLWPICVLHNICPRRWHLNESSSGSPFASNSRDSDNLRFFTGSPQTKNIYKFQIIYLI